MRLIDADTLKAYIDMQEGRPFIGYTIKKTLKMMVDEQPTIEQEQKTGHWIHKPFAYQCSTCGEDSDWPSEYCPWCGAKMGKEQ